MQIPTAPSPETADAGVQVRPVSGALGAEVLGVDLSQPLSDEAFAAIRQAFLEHLVIFFRDQAITPAQHRAFAARFFELDSHPFVQGLENIPQILEIVKQPDEFRNWGGTWHADVTFQPDPSVGAVLLAREVPDYGGDTLFANMYLAYETLSDGMKRLLEGLEAVHDSGEVGAFYANFKGMRATSGSRTQSVHPVVRTHPETGRKALFVNSVYTSHFKDMTVEESHPLLHYLCSHAVRAEFTCRFRWRPGSVAVWDNRVTQHSPIDDDFRARKGDAGFRRVMHRATFAGERPV